MASTPGPKEQDLRDAAERILAQWEPDTTETDDGDAGLGLLANVAYRPHPTAVDYIPMTAQIRSVRLVLPQMDASHE